MDEGVRGDTDAKGLAGLKPAFQAGGTTTAGNCAYLLSNESLLAVRFRRCSAA